MTDASPVGLEAVLVQQHRDVKRAVCFASLSLNDVERRYSQEEKEALVVVWTFERFHLYIRGLETFALVTDRKALKAIYGPKSKPPSSARVERWVLPLMSYQFAVRCVSSGQNIADCLSRLTKVPASSHHGRLAEKYVRMVADNATLPALKTLEMEKASVDNEELMKVHAHWRFGAGHCSRGVRDDPRRNYCCRETGDERYTYCHAREVKKGSSGVGQRGATWDCEDEG